MSFFIFKYLDVENYNKIHQELSNFAIPYSQGKPTGLWTIPLNNFLKNCTITDKYFLDLGIKNKLEKCCIIVVHPGTKEKDAHIDKKIEPPIIGPCESRGCLSLNFNIQNGDITTVFLYEYISGPKTIVDLPDRSEGSYIFYSGADLKEIGKYCLTKPVLMNNTVPHAIVNNTDATRISLSFRFSSDPWELTV